MTEDITLHMRVTRTYDITSTLTAEQFIRLVDEKSEQGLIDMDLGEAALAATTLYDQGDLTSLVGVRDEEIEYIEAPNRPVIIARPGDGHYYYRDEADNIGARVYMPHEYIEGTEPDRYDVKNWGHTHQWEEGDGFWMNCPCGESKRIPSWPLGDIDI